MKKKLILGVTLGGSSRLLDGQAAYFKELGYEVYLISQDHFKEPIFCKKEGITHLPVKNIVADIHPFKDIVALFQIMNHFRKVKPDIVNVGTPKMGLLGLIAASIFRVEKRIYTCRGLRFETETGIKRHILMLMEKGTVKMAHQVIYVSPSLLKAAEKYGVTQSKKATVIGFGSSNGVNISEFDKAKIKQEERRALQKKYNLDNVITIGFVGRVTQHKGAYELVEAFEKIYAKHSNTRLILMGHIKCNEAFEIKFQEHPGIIHIPFQDNVPLYMSLFDIFVLPSWREGFPNVPIQAAAMNIPVVVSDATGCVDAVDNGKNGVIFPIRDAKAIETLLLQYVEDENLRTKHANAGSEWASKFNNKIIWQGINNIYEF